MPAMRALYTSAPGDFRLVDRPRPEPRGEKALIRVTRASICHTDIVIRAGKAGHVRYPVIAGHEFCGVVVETGAAAAHIAPGDRVAVRSILSCGSCLPCRAGRTNWCEHYDELGSITDGGFAEYCAVPARHLVKMPDAVSDASGAMIEPLANAVAAVTQAQIAEGDKVVVIGPGPIGCLVAQVARLRCPSVLVMVGTRGSRLALGVRAGATHTVNATEPDSSQRLDEILGGKGADAIIECAGTRSALELAMEHIGVLGRVAVEGLHERDEKVSLSPYRFLLLKSARLVGVTGWNEEDFRVAMDLLARGRVDAESLVTHLFPLDRWEDAFEMAAFRKDQSLKVQLECTK